MQKKTVNFPDSQIALKAKGLEKTYPGGERAALDGVDITIGAGGLFGLLGPNGAGKTTAISIMSSLLRPTRGAVEVFGFNVLCHGRQVKQMIGLVPQEIALYRDLTARENLRYFAGLYGLRGRALAKRLDECLDFVGLLDKADQRVGRYSGGMKRRINLAVGILHQPRLLFLDEPTVGIDAQSRNMILGSLATLNEQGTTMVYTTHYMEEAERLCKEVAIIDNGRIISQGEPGTLVSEGGYDNLQELFFSLTGRSLRD
ncbi:MAG: ATP-binding cassette domain-containing protein [Thermodesulfobacteriota bacterium]